MATGAASTCAWLKDAARRADLSAGLRTNTKRQGCTLAEDGARLARAKIRSRSASGIGAGLYLRIERRASMASGTERAAAREAGAGEREPSGGVMVVSA